jgi:hypothetical protein
MSQNRSATGVGERLTRYDLILLAIPVALLASLLAHVAVGVPLRTTLVPASLVGALAIVDAVFLNPPTAGDRDA